MKEDQNVVEGKVTVAPSVGLHLHQDSLSPKLNSVPPLGAQPLGENLDRLLQQLRRVAMTTLRISMSGAQVNTNQQQQQQEEEEEEAHPLLSSAR